MHWLPMSGGHLSVPFVDTGLLTRIDGGGSMEVRAVTELANQHAG